MRQIDLFYSTRGDTLHFHEPKPSYRDTLTGSRPNSRPTSRGNSSTSLPHHRRSNHAMSRDNSCHDLRYNRDTHQGDTNGPSRDDSGPSSRDTHPEQHRNNRDTRPRDDNRPPRDNSGPSSRDTHPDQQPKNGDRPQTGANQRSPTNEEMMNFIKATMRNLELFRKQLTN